MKKNEYTYDVVAMGELLIDFTGVGKSATDMLLFEQNPGGAPANLACAISHLGGKSAFIGKVGEDMHGKFLKDTLINMKVDTSSLILDSEVFTTLAFVSINQQGERAFSFGRKPGADTCLKYEEIQLSLIENTRIFHVGSLSLTDEPVRSTTYDIVKYAKNAGVTLSYDPNYRASLWKSEGEAKKYMRSLIPFMDIIKISDEEITLLTDETTPQNAAKKLMGAGIKCVIITMGSKGAYFQSKDGNFFVNSFPTDVVDTTGAGDAFYGGFLFKLTQSKKLLDDISIEEFREYLCFGNATASKCIGARGGIMSLPNYSQVMQIINSQK